VPRHYRPPEHQTVERGVVVGVANDVTDVGGVEPPPRSVEGAAAVALDRVERARAVLEFPAPRPDLGSLVAVVEASALAPNARANLVARLRADDATARAIESAVTRGFGDVDRAALSEQLRRVIEVLPSRATGADPDALVADAARAAGLPDAYAEQVPALCGALAAMLLDEEEEDDAHEMAEPA